MIQHINLTDFDKISARRQMVVKTPRKSSSESRDVARRHTGERKDNRNGASSRLSQVLGGSA